MDILGLNNAIQNAISKIPGLEDHLAQEVQSVITAEINNLKTLEDPALAAIANAVDAVNGIKDEVSHIRQMVERVIGGMAIQAMFVPKPATQVVNLDQPLPEVKE